jgi:hypothetical protein
VGQFVSEDPIGFGAGDGNLYRYVFNSPINFTDPEGEFLVPALAGAGVAAAASLVGEALFPAPAQAPTAPDDLHPDDNGWKRLAVELGLSAGPGLVKAGEAWVQALAAAGDEALEATLRNASKALKNLFGSSGDDLANTLGQQSDELGKATQNAPEEAADAGASSAGGSSCLIDGASSNFGGSTPPLSIDDAQLSQKLGQHMGDFGGNPASSVDRAAVRSIIEDIGSNPDVVVNGTFRGQGPNGTRGPVQFRIKGNDVVVTKPDGTFVTIFKDGVLNNTSVKNALGSNQ